MTLEHSCLYQSLASIKPTDTDTLLRRDLLDCNTIQYNTTNSMPDR